MVAEMLKLREILDSKNIHWEDESDSINSKFGISRTHFYTNGVLVSVINGYGTYGGYDLFTERNSGLLEMMSPIVDSGCPVGYLGADDVIKLLNI